jgi:4-alpha-glucanotransferase
MHSRVSGILLHPTSLPGPHGTGDLGPTAYRFADFLAAAGQSIWQVLPLGPTGYGDSPYQLFSAFAGNPLLISLDRLVEAGLLERDDIAGAPRFPAAEADYPGAQAFKMPLLKKAWRRFHGIAEPTSTAAFEAFRRRHSAWLDDFALFMAVKDAQEEPGAWTAWETPIAGREPAVVVRWRQVLDEQIRAEQFYQYLFFVQWHELKNYCRARGIRLMGDIPIYVAHDSADVWAHPELFQLREDGTPAVMAGVPPDYFSATGQLWGNPIYRWDVMEAGGFRWWIDRFRAAFDMLDMVRLDHFRGFEAYWEVPGGEATAINGRWVKGPGRGLFRVLERELGRLPIVAENLGVITPEVEAIRHEFGFPGMSVLQFAFGSDPQAPTFRPHAYPREVVAYSGTHDNDTTVGWWRSSGAGDSTRSAAEIEAERQYARTYLNTDGSEINWAFIRALMASVADTVLIPMQDVLGLGSAARMNVPARPSGNWKWRMAEGAATPQLAARLRVLVTTFERQGQQAAAPK